MKAIGALLLLAACGVFAEEPKPAGSLPPEIRAKIWRRQAERIAADKESDRAKRAYDEVIAEAKQACGGRDLVADKDGEPTCAASVEHAKEPPK